MLTIERDIVGKGISLILLVVISQEPSFMTKTLPLTCQLVDEKSQRPTNTLKERKTSLKIKANFSILTYIFKTKTRHLLFVIEIIHGPSRHFRKCKKG